MFPVPVFAAFGFVKNFDIPTDSLRRAEYQNLAALFIFTVKLFFSGPRIRIIAEDNANAEGAVTYRHSSFKTILFIQSRNPVVFFCLTIHSLILMKRLGSIRTSRQIRICLRTI